jgi:predicted nucleic acid-binding protein
MKNNVWAAPMLWRSEFRSVLSFYIRKKIITLSEAMQIFEEAESLFQNKEYEVNSMQVLKLVQESGCSAYDCEFVNLAQDLNVPLVTMDKKVLNNFKNTATSIPEYIEEH